MNAVPASSSGAPIRALVVDSDRDSRQMYTEYLQRAAFEVFEAEDGREALAKAISRRPGIIVTETQLPGIDGFHLCELLRADLFTRATPIIVVTADAYPPDLVRAERAGADVVLTKPCLPDQLLATIRQCLEKSAALRERAVAARLNADRQIARAGVRLERSRRIRKPMSHAFNRHNTVTPALTPPALRCPSCDRPLVYQDSHVGGVSEHHQEQWDYYECSGSCGTFQYRQRTRKLRSLTPGTASSPPRKSDGQ
jgi:two-component system, cell cycle response regulator DivK